MKLFDLLVAILMVILLLGLSGCETLGMGELKTAGGHVAEGDAGAWMGEANMKITPLFKGERFPNVAVGVDGSVIATFGTGSIRVMRSEDGGETWSEESTIAAKGFQGGGLTVDENTGDVITFVEASHPPAPIEIYRSKDHGKTWAKQPTVIAKDSKGNLPSMHMNDHGITLRHGKYKGRLIRATRSYAGKNDRSLWPKHYTNAIYSDDGGKTWSTSEPFPAFGTGEAGMVELSDGTIYYNSRRHWAEEGANPLRRWTAVSDDGGVTWKDLKICEVLPDGPQNTNYGCMGGLTRVPMKGRDVLLYSNCDSASGRTHGTVWASFDGGKTWPVKRLVYAGKFAYSSMIAGRPGTLSAGWIYLHFEGGPKGASAVAKFNLNWVLGGKATGDGKVPSWVKAKS